MKKLTYAHTLRSAYKMMPKDEKDVHEAGERRLKHGRGAEGYWFMG